MGKNTSITLREHFEKIQGLKSAIQEGIDSGLAVNFDPKAHLEQLKKSR